MRVVSHSDFRGPWGFDGVESTIHINIAEKRFLRVGGDNQVIFEDVIEQSIPIDNGYALLLRSAGGKSEVVVIKKYSSDRLLLIEKRDGDYVTVLKRAQTK